MPYESIGFTHIFLVYGTKAIIPTDIEFDSLGDTLYMEDDTKEVREDDVDLLEECGHPES